jgi:hypothetical protein
MLEYIKRESVQDALERGLKEMEEYAQENPNLKNGFSDYFRYGNTNRILHHISTGRISPWLIYNCASGVDFLGSLAQDQVEMILPIIDPTYWNVYFQDLSTDIEWARGVLKVAKL